MSLSLPDVDEELTKIFYYLCFFSCLTPLHTHSDTHRQNNMHGLSDSNLHNVVLALQTIHCPCLRQIFKIWKPKSHVEQFWTTYSVFVMANRLVTNLLHSFFWWWTTGLVNSLNYAMTTYSNPNIDQWSTDKIKDDMTSCYLSKTTEKLP